MSDLDLFLLSRCYGRTFSDAELMMGGANRTYRLIADGAPVFLRLYRPYGRSNAEIAFELRLLREAQPMPGLVVARPIATRNGRDRVRLPFEDTLRNACLFEALAGRPPTPARDDQALFGSALAKLHRALSGIPGGETRPLEPIDLHTRALTALAKIPGSQVVRAAILGHSLDPFRALSLSDLSTGNCHGDAWAGNVLIQDRTVGFLDFDECGYGPYLLDLGQAAWRLIVGQDAIPEESLTALLTGYEMVRPLVEQERRALPLFVKLAEIRALLFLAEFCILGDLWPRVFERSIQLLEHDWLPCRPGAVAAEGGARTPRPR